MGLIKKKDNKDKRNYMKLRAKVLAVACKHDGKESLTLHRSLTVGQPVRGCAKKKKKKRRKIKQRAGQRQGVDSPC